MLRDRRVDVFPRLAYANCWEDGNVICAALEPASRKRILSIASAGDNCFALAAEGAEVVAVDRNPSQLACMELKQAALRQLSYEDVLGFFGLKEFHRRRDVFDALKADLSERALTYWNARLEEIESGFVHSGKLEGYFGYFRRFVLPFIHSRSVVTDLVSEKTRNERERFYDEVWSNFRWRVLIRIFFNRTVMSWLGRDVSCFTYVDKSVADHMANRARHALIELPTHTNPFIEYILTGTFSRNLPRYLERSRFTAVREGLDRITLFEGQIEDAALECARDGFDGFNLSDLFEYLSMPTGREVHSKLVRQARPGARLAYWNMMAPRRFAGQAHAGVVERKDLADPLHASDPGFFYRAFILEEVRP